MGYTARDLQRNGKEILDKAESAPVLIRRGESYFEISKVKYQAIDENKKNSIVTQPKVYQEPTILPDSQEWVEYTPPKENNYVENKPTAVTTHKSLDDLLQDGSIKRGV